MPLPIPPPLRLPDRPTSPALVLGRRLLVALALIAFVAVIAYLERDGYRDGDEVGSLTLLDCFYYASVSVTTTGYGDITPVTEGARLTTTLIVTPARILFRLRDHTIVYGFGTKGRNPEDHRPEETA